MIGILIVDDHPALRAGMTVVLRAEPGLVPLDAVASASELWPALERYSPDVVVLDLHLPDDDGLSICRQVKRRASPPAVLLYSAYVDSALTIPALLAGVDGMVDKAAPAPELFDALRRVARGERVLPPISPELLDSAGGRLAPEQLPILGMALEGTPADEIAAVLGRTDRELSHELDRMIGRLKVELPAARQAP